MSDKIRTEFWGERLDSIMTEIAREASICKVRLLDAGVVEAVLHGSDSVCGSHNPRAFKKLRDLLMMGFIVRGQAVERLGPDEVAQIGQAIREKLVARFGDRLGG
ncbi:MAG: hypothetical protein JSR84_08495 [Proteobacteria bacterium]|nr:hypothetical protein [Pseudomonadota bacterium]